MVNQILIATNMIGVCEALLYGYKAGLDLKTVLQSVGPGAAGSWSLSNLGPRIIANNFDPGFFVEHFIKDMGIALDEAKRMGLSLPGLALAQQLYLALQAQGHGRDGTHALELALAQLSGIDWKRRSQSGRFPTCRVIWMCALLLAHAPPTPAPHAHRRAHILAKSHGSCRRGR